MWQLTARHGQRLSGLRHLVAMPHRQKSATNIILELPPMTTLIAFAADITFFEVCLSLLTVGLIERVVIRLPEEMVGPGGWLLDTGES